MFYHADPLPTMLNRQEKKTETYAVFALKFIIQDIKVYLIYIGTNRVTTQDTMMRVDKADPFNTFTNFSTRFMVGNY